MFQDGLKQYIVEGDLEFLTLLPLTGIIGMCHYVWSIWGGNGTLGRQGHYNGAPALAWISFVFTRSRQWVSSRFYYFFSPEFISLGIFPRPAGMFPQTSYSGPHAGFVVKYLYLRSWVMAQLVAVGLLA